MAIACNDRVAKVALRTGAYKRLELMQGARGCFAKLGAPKPGEYPDGQENHRAGAAAAQRRMDTRPGPRGQQQAGDQHGLRIRVFSLIVFSNSLRAFFLCPCGCGAPMLRFRFTLRSLMVLVALLSILMAWVVRPLWRARHERYLASQLELAAASVFYGPYSIGGFKLAQLPEWMLTPCDWLVRACGESTFAHVTEVQLWTSKPDAAAMLVQLPALTEVTLSLVSLTDRDVEALAKCRNLRYLRLHDVSIPEASLGRLAELELVELDMSGLTVTDEWMQVASQIPTLRALYIHGAFGDYDLGITGAGLRQLERLPNLEVLVIACCEKIDDEALQCVTNLKGLRCLGLRALPISDRSCEVIASLADLRSLAITNCRMTSDGISALRALRTLEELDLSSTSVADRGIAALSQLLNFQTLNITNTDCTASIGEQLQCFRNLKCLALGPDVPPEGARRIKRLLPSCKVRLLYGQEILVFD